MSHDLAGQARRGRSARARAPSSSCRRSLRRRRTSRYSSARRMDVPERALPRAGERREEVAAPSRAVLRAVVCASCSSARARTAVLPVAGWSIRSGRTPSARSTRATMSSARAHRVDLASRSVTIPSCSRRCSPTTAVAASGCCRTTAAGSRRSSAPNVDLVTERSSRSRRRAVIDTYGRRHEVDVIVLRDRLPRGSFSRADARSIGRGGAALRERWGEEPARTSASRCPTSRTCSVCTDPAPTSLTRAASSSTPSARCATYSAACVRASSAARRSSAGRTPIATTPEDCEPRSRGWSGHTAA